MILFVSIFFCSVGHLIVLVVSPVSYISQTTRMVVGSQLSVSPVLGDIMPSSGCQGYFTHMAHILCADTRSHTQKSIYPFVICASGTVAEEPLPKLKSQVCTPVSSESFNGFSSRIWFYDPVWVHVVKGYCLHLLICYCLWQGLV